MRKFIAWSPVFIVVVLLALNITNAQGSGLDVLPHIIDEKVKARDILKYSLKLTNNTDRKASLYTIVQEVTADGGTYSLNESRKLDRQTSLTKWISIKRGAIHIEPGEVAEIPLKIEVSMYAEPGKYYASLTFAQGNNITIAQQNMRTGVYPRLMINFEVEEEIIEKAQIKEFEPERKIYFGFPVNLILTLDNFGNRDIVPAGRIFIYNRSGKEVAELKVNAEEKKIKSESSGTLASAWEAGAGFGKFKAKLELEYGQKNTRDLQDTIYFWIFPWRVLAIISGGLFIVVLILIMVIFKKTYQRHHPYDVIIDSRHEPVVDLKKSNKQKS